MVTWHATVSLKGTTMDYFAFILYEFLQYADLNAAKLLNASVLDFCYASIEFPNTNMRHDRNLQLIERCNV